MSILVLSTLDGSHAFSGQIRNVGESKIALPVILTVKIPVPPKTAKFGSNPSNFARNSHSDPH